ncbi:DUF1173 family protein [Aquipseudomonas alcaligenes]|uniref:DUF1173 family protein n=1 Tax=Aquipseudomonas alcaligenes TaxID=43263 RepID=A0A1N6X8F3_AQUAC|nr:DUF1173 family protein [Pseudomonas alcaligenes]SIQ98635.1 Protein of unknown function [Pseudomonas alcaligenes]
MDKCYPVRITHADKSEKNYSSQFQTAAEYAKPWKAVLTKAHAGGQVFCQCFGRGRKQLAVRHLADADGYCLARYPRTGPEHSSDCQYYSPDATKSGMQGYAESVVEEGEDGGLRVKLALSLRRKDPLESAAGTPTGTSAGTARPRQPAMTLLGLLHLLWSESRLNTWYPKMEGKRRLGLVHAKLQQTASSILIAGARLNDFLLVAATDNDKRQADANKAKANEAQRLSRRLVVIAPLAKHSAEAEAGLGRLPISGFAGIPILTLSNALWASALRSFPQEISAWKRQGKVMAIAITDTPERGRANVLRLALMSVSERWIPVASSHEARVEQLLAEQQRSFWKPLRFDAAEEEVFPDFWLLDTGEAEFPLEVFGRSDEVYCARKFAKHSLYDKQYTPSGWWCWDAAKDPDGKAIPPFPANKPA